MGDVKEESINLQLIDNQSPYKRCIDAGKRIHSDGGEPSSQEANNYDPHQHRDRPFPTTNTETLVHLLKGSLGTGILAMPNAFRNSGLVVGVIATIAIGALCTYCIHVLVKAQYRLCKKLRVPILSYPMSMKYALEGGPYPVKIFAPCAPVIVDSFLVLYQLGICCVYIVFVSSNIKQVLDEYWQPMDIKIYMLILMLPLILINYIRNLKLLAPFSTVANLITFVALSMTLVYMFDDLPPLRERELYGTLKNFSLYFGTTLFALEAVGVIIALENNMKNPQDFGGYFGVFNTAMVVIVLLYTVVGFFGYIKYGSEVGGSVTFNLPQEEIMAQSIKIMFALAIFISYALQAYVPVEILWHTYLEQRIRKYKVFWEYVCRTIFSLISFALAFCVPRLGLFISLFGALCLSALGISFPAIIDICIRWPDKALGPFKVILLRDIFLIFFGLIGLVCGTYVSLEAIIDSFKPPAET